MLTVEIKDKVVLVTERSKTKSSWLPAPIAE